MLLRPAQTDGPVEVYLGLRAQSLAFLGGFLVFPGGCVDPGDSQIEVRHAPSDADMCSAALRELFEETGVLAVPGADRLSTAQRTAWRRDLERDAGAWQRELTRLGLHIDGSVLTPCGRWLTPPFTAPSYLAQYFGVWLPAGMQPEIWPGELTDGLWITPEAAIIQHEAGTLAITFPVLETLLILRDQGGDLGATGPHAEERSATAYPHGGGEMLSGVHLVPLRTVTLPPATHTNCYILGRRELVVVDPGPVDPDEQTRLLGYLEFLRGRGGQVKEIWLTHFHHDHVGAAQRLAETFGVPIAAHRDTAARLHGQVPVHRLIEDGETTGFASLGHDSEWTALHTPGHAHGHLCFHEARRGHVLCGDNILGVGTTLVAPAPDGSMRDYLASLRRLQGLKLGMLFPGHGPPLAAAGPTIARYLTHRAQREAAILAVLGAPLAIPDIVTRVYTDVDPSLHGLAALTVQAHLEKLELDGQVERRGDHFVKASPAVPQEG